MNPRIHEWSGQRVWLIGASEGIGAELAQQLARLGARLALSARHLPRLQGLALPDALLLPCDVTDAASIRSTHTALIDAWHGIDVVIYLAGDYEPMGASDFDLDVAEKVIDVNFRGAMRVAATVLKNLRPGGGIAFVASVAGYRGLPRALCYGPGKAALIHFAECLHLELEPSGIGVWLINPGFVDTRLTAKNDFSMPALLSARQAAEQMIRGFATGVFEIHFPRRFTWWMKAARLLPYRWYFKITRRLTKS